VAARLRTKKRVDAIIYSVLVEAFLMGFGFPISINLLLAKIRFLNKEKSARCDKNCDISISDSNFLTIPDGLGQ
jgi:hypothetical protein